MVGQTSGILGVVAFGVVTIALGQVTAILMLAVFFTGGLVLMSRIDMQEGLQVARDAEIAMGIPDVTTTS
jgi:hypothetical protein